jgi:hypothetical protein
MQHECPFSSLVFLGREKTCNIHMNSYMASSCLFYFCSQWVTNRTLTEVYNYIQSFLVACCCFRMYNGRWWMYLYCLLDICFPIIYHIWKFIGCWCSSAGTRYLVRWT